MVDAAASPRLLYRLGRRSPGNFAPRTGKDTIGQVGRPPGLSTLESVQLGPGQLAQVIGLDLLQPPLRPIPDDPSQGGVAGHFAIAPVDNAGLVNQSLLEEWAAARGNQPPHPLTVNLLKAVTNAIVGTGP
jgi:hypothetical protein